MKNREKFAKEILDIVCKGNRFAVTKSGKIVNCSSIGCNECLFDNISIDCVCDVSLERWSESEYIEKPTITSKEKVFLDLILPKYKYIARDNGTNKLYLYIDKPSKHYTYWLPELNDSAYELLYKPLDIKFDFIKWDDEEPWSIEDLKKLEVKDE